jgi:flavin-dependent dehydrogenase
VRRLLDDGGSAFPERDHRPLAAFSTAWEDERLLRRSLPFWRVRSGLVLDRAALDRWLLDGAEAAGATVVRGCRVATGARTDRGVWRLAGAVDGRPRELRARFVVEATGRSVRSVTHPDTSRAATDALVGLSGELPDRTPTDDALVEACREGWWYTVSAPAGMRTVTLFTDADLVASASDRAAWFAELLGRTAHVRHTVPDPPWRPRLRGHTARTSIRRALLRDGSLAVGDAAAFVDPLSGTGIERALVDGVAAADALDAALDGGSSEPLRQHAVGQAEAFRESLVLQSRHYGAVRRWPDAPFWRRRCRDIR